MMSLNKKLIRYRFEGLHFIKVIIDTVRPTHSFGPVMLPKLVICHF